MIAGGLAPKDLIFDAPSEFPAFCDQMQNTKRCVFHPNGGKAKYSFFESIPANLLEKDTAGEWSVNNYNQVSNLGITEHQPDITSSEIISFISGLNASTCAYINENLGINGIPKEKNIATTANMAHKSVNSDPITGGTIGLSDNGLASQPFGCFQQNGVNFYFHVLVEQ